VVAGLDDSASGQLYLYAGDKAATGLPVEQAGLTGGVLYGVQVAGLTQETDATVLNGPTPLTVHLFGNVAYTTGAQLEALSLANGVTAFNRRGQILIQEDPGSQRYLARSAARRPTAGHAALRQVPSAFIRVHLRFLQLQRPASPSAQFIQLLFSVPIPETY
jgi:hypothetical protein